MNNIRKARLNSGLTQQELAEKIEVFQIDISRYETGKFQPSAKRLTKLALVLNCSIEYLLGEDE
jgi:transcriptional regulator with XRE-family HTH domain